MKCMLCTFCTLIFFPVWAALSPEDIRNMPVHGNEQTLLYGNPCEDPAFPGMRLMNGFKVVSGEGMNGTSALKVSRSLPLKQDQYMTLDLPEIPGGTKCVLKFQVRGKDVNFPGGGSDSAFFPYAAIEYRDAATGKNLGGTGDWCRVPTMEDYHEMTIGFTVPEGKRPFLALRLSKNWSGTLWFDDIYLYRKGISYAVILSRPAQHTFQTDDGKFKVHVYDPLSRKTVLLASLIRDGKTFLETVVEPDTQNDFRGDFGTDIPEGPAQLKTILADIQTGEQICKSEFDVRIRRSQTPPSYAVLIDDSDRLVISGKPFLLKAIDFHLPGYTPEQLGNVYEKFQKAGFNTVITTCWIRRYSGVTASNQVAETRKAFDQLLKYNLKTLVAMSPLYDGYRWQPKDFAGAKGMRNMTKKIVETLWDHPGILGWYISDEIPVSKIAEVLDMRKILNTADPWRPTMTLTYVSTAFPGYAVSGDISCIDVYPLSRTTRKKASIRPISEAMKQCRLAGVPLWGYVQAFNWAYFRGDVKTPEDYAEFITPTGEDIRSMILLFALEGVRGFGFFIYPEAKEYVEKPKQFCDPEHPVKMWNSIAEGMDVFKHFELYLLGKNPPSPLKCSNATESVVKAAVFTAESGKRGVVVVCCDGAGADATFSLPELPRLQSVYGRTENLGNGKYHFTSSGIASDILLERGEK